MIKLSKYITVLILMNFNLSYSDTLTLKNAVETALMNNYSIRIAKKSNQIAGNNVIPGNAGMLPKIDVVAGYNFSNTDLNMLLITGQQIKQDGNISKTVNGGVQLSWTILDDMGMFISYERLKALKSKSDIEFKISVENLIKEISRAYYNSLLFEQNLEVISESIKLSNLRIERIKNKMDFGNSTSIELLKAVVDLNTDSANFKRTLLNLNSAKRLLLYLMGNQSNTDFVVDRNIDFRINNELNNLVNLARKSSNTILQAIKNKEITDLDYQLIKTNFMPKVNLTASYSYNRTDADAGFMLVNQNSGLSSGINLSWNIFDGMRTNLQAQNTKLISEMNSLTVEMLSDQIDMAVRNNFDEFTEKKNILEMDLSNLNAAEQNLNRSLDLYNLGQITSVELREAQLNLTRAKMRINESTIDAKLSEIELGILTGTLKY
jgi:outer membrane protein TolC